MFGDLFREIEDEVFEAKGVFWGKTPDMVGEVESGSGESGTFGEEFFFWVHERIMQEVG